MAAFQYSVQSRYGLSDERIRYYAPSVFAEEPHESRSSRYGYVPTSHILAELRRNGFVPIAAMQSRSRSEDRREKTKHLLRFCPAQAIGRDYDDVFNVVLVNSHDGSSAYDLYAGIFRIVCSNGLIAMDAGSSVKVQHRGDIVGNVVESTLRIVEESGEVMDQVARMKAIQLTQPERLLLSEFALKARFDLDEDDAEGTHKVVPYTPADFLVPHRPADEKSDLYTTFNVVQENCIKGGVEVQDANGKKRKSRAVRGIDGQTRVNSLLWQFTKRLMDMKG